VEITAQELNRATLGRQLLLGREALEPGEAVRRVVALQAQHAASPYVALWNRLTGLVAAALRWAGALPEGREIVAVTQAANLASRRLLEAVGMRHEDDIVEFGEKQAVYRRVTGRG
jgi:hypothetical protein